MFSIDLPMFEFSYSQSYERFFSFMKYEYTILLFDTDESNDKLFRMLYDCFNIKFNNRSDALIFIENENNKQRVFLTSSKTTYFDNILKIDDNCGITKKKY